MPASRIALDITPLQNSHRYRGIGAYVRGLAARLGRQTEIPIEFWGWSGELEFAPHPPHTLLLLPRFPMPEYRATWLFARIGMRLRSLRSKVRAVHITDPDALIGLADRKVMATVYDLIPLKQGVRSLPLLARSGYRSYVKALPRTDILFSISEQTSDDLKQQLGVPAGKIVLARPGIDIAPASGASPPRERPYFVFIGGPNPNKNLDVLLEAMKASPELPEELLVIGRWLPKQVTALSRRLEVDGLAHRVRHIGYVPDAKLTHLMKDSTAVVVPSLLEGFGLPVGEGMAAGAAVLHSRLPVLEETSAGAALTFDPHSPTELAECLRRVSRDASLRDRLRDFGLQRAKELTWDSAVDNTLQTYRALLKP